MNVNESMRAKRASKPAESNRIDIGKIREMLFHDDSYVAAFAAASIESFTEFAENFSHCLLEKDIKGVQKAVHKIKPVASMLDLEEIISECKTARQLLEQNRPPNELRQIVRRVDHLCQMVIREFEMILKMSA